MPYPDNSPNCPIKSCPKTRAADQLMCGLHWRRVPHHLQRLVYRTWQNRLASDEFAVSVHEDAKRQAIEAVEALEAR